MKVLSHLLRSPWRCLACFGCVCADIRSRYNAGEIFKDSDRMPKGDAGIGLRLREIKGRELAVLQQRRNQSVLHPERNTSAPLFVYFLLSLWRI